LCAFDGEFVVRICRVLFLCCGSWRAVTSCGSRFDAVQEGAILNVDAEDGVGHVVVGVPGMGVLLDGSIDQASRPRKNILLEPFAVHLPETGFFSHSDGRCGNEASSGSGRRGSAPHRGGRCCRRQSC